MPEPPPFGYPEGNDWLVLTENVLPTTSALEWVEGERWGGVVSFFGLVRDHAEGRTDVLAVDYEAYEEQVLPRFSELADTARVQVPDLGRIVIWHRIGHLTVGEMSVAVVVSAPHRGEAFEACRFLIDTLKATVPIWKLEHWAAGSDWSPSAHAVGEIRPIEDGRPAEAGPTS